jgi:concanavalin A-like lectin/glucanase superfamily protein
MKKILLLTIALLIIAQLAFAEQTFYTALEDADSVEAAGGTFHGGEFDSGALGNGFMSIAPTDVVTFPVEDRFTNLEEGTVELFLTLGVDASTFSGELFMFITYKRGTDVLDLSWNNNVARARIKSAGSWSSADSEPLDWKEGETHHMAHTWGPGGLNLYLDGELAGEHGFTGGPTQFSTWMAINNVEPANANFPSSCVVDELRIFDHQKEVDELIIDPKAAFSVEHRGKATMTWGKIKNLY